MEDVSLAHAKEHLEELVRRAAAGEEVRIVDPELGAVTLGPGAASNSTRQSKPDPQINIAAPRVTDTMPKFVPLTKARVLGHLKGVIPLPPDDFFDPMSDEDLKDWYGI